ncbi:uncharacterized protein LOC118736226 [Rhagoletis pomonella]|uniref:uncharacterized protein LOC118736226 n=1 Tax=Rhagoletis pomonella TaxID=28610 RepID=UPI00178477BD|nr:uncharacterized protein LOC118736226 [Rhagoletis pomonella]
MYNDFMQEYIQLGHMSQIKDIDLNFPHYVIPHQCVLRPDAETTKLRVVFDASCKSTTHVSLNELLMVGPTIQPELFTTLLRFRCRKWAITADITKMYRQVAISDDDKKFQLILYRHSPDEPIRTYCLNTVTYGTAPAPFLAIRCLQHLSDMFADQYPLGCKVIREEFYADDMLSGANDITELKQIQKEVVEILNSGGFKLAKWHSNHPSLLEKENYEKALEDDGNSTIYALGVTWSP